MAYVPQEYPASRPGIPSLLVVVAGIALFMIYTFWAALVALFSA